MKHHVTKTLTLIAAITIATISNNIAHAVPIADGYVGGDDNGYGDVISSASNYNTFNITSMDVERSGNILSVSINTGFSGKGNDHLFNGLTNGQGIGYGDLFLSSTWNPSGTAPYYNDDNTNGTIWTYGFSLEDRWMDEALINGSGTLYELKSGNNDADALLSDDFISAPTFRNGQEVAVDISSSGVEEVLGNNSSWSLTTGKINFLIDLTGTDLISSNTIALHWGMTCANDTIEGEYSVPEPAILGLLAMGLIGIGISKRKNA